MNQQNNNINDVNNNSNSNDNGGKKGDEDNSSLWVFGYGSLCWLPGFEYGESVVGHIEGFSRKFWQGNVTHRGTPNQVQ